MDVTSLLNESQLAVEQQRKGLEGLKLPTRSRTPWDAGGYSLPLATSSTAASPSISTITFHRSASEGPHQRSFSDVVHIKTHRSQTSDGPSSPIHKSTDSRSSLSSFASSRESTTHSRLSSVSTINSSYNPNNNCTGQSLSPKSVSPQLGGSSVLMAPDNLHVDCEERILPNGKRIDFRFCLSL